jgi:8-oxo-dGTP pyrophosphatase MutT (NUDIX family)
VYGVLIDEQNRVLVSDEEEDGFRFSKFPGGGLEYGEGLLEALSREFIEECTLPIEIVSHFYTTDFFIKSVFNESQVISVYYLVKALEPLAVPIKENTFDFHDEGPVKQAFRWKAISEIQPKEFTFETDQRVAELLILGTIK